MCRNRHKEIKKLFLTTKISFLENTKAASVYITRSRPRQFVVLHPPERVERRHPVDDKQHDADEERVAQELRSGQTLFDVRLNQRSDVDH